jgi:hypothetical protein
MNKIPTIKEIESKTRVHFGKSVRIEVVSDIFFTIFGIEFVIPKGFASDGASLPFFAKAFISPYNQMWVFASLVHDYLYATQFIPRSISDSVFGYILKVTSTWYIAYLFEKAVRIFGFIAWDSNKRKGLQRFPEAKRRLIKHICKKK